MYSDDQQAYDAIQVAHHALLDLITSKAKNALDTRQWAAVTRYVTAARQLDEGLGSPKVLEEFSFPLYQYLKHARGIQEDDLEMAFMVLRVPLPQLD